MSEVFTSPLIEKPRKGFPFRVVVRIVHPGVANAEWITGSHYKTRAAADRALNAWRDGKGFIAGDVIEDLQRPEELL